MQINGGTRDLNNSRAWLEQCDDFGESVNTTRLLDTSFGFLSVAIPTLAFVIACRADAHQHGLDPGSRDALGPAVAIRAGGIEIVLNSIRQQVFSPDCFSELGIDVAAKRLVVVKSTQHFRAGFDKLGATTVYCDAPGSLNSHISSLPYRFLRQAIWPLGPIPPEPS